MSMAELEIERQSSIEMEPRTLNINQIEFAREAALYVVNTRSIEEALNIFTEGLEPVVRIGEESGDCCCDGEVEDHNYCSKDDPIRDIVSAPF